MAQNAPEPEPAAITRLNNLFTLGGVFTIIWLCLSGLGTMIFVGLRDNAPTAAENSLGMFCLLADASTLLAVIFNFKALGRLKHTASLSLPRAARVLNLVAGLLGLIQVGGGLLSEHHPSSEETAIALTLGLVPLVLIGLGILLSVALADPELAMVLSARHSPDVRRPADAPAQVEPEDFEVDGGWDQGRRHDETGTEKE